MQNYINVHNVEDVTNQTYDARIFICTLIDLLCSFFVVMYINYYINLCILARLFRMLFDVPQLH
jgi:hypothetical protein